MSDEIFMPAAEGATSYELITKWEFEDSTTRTIRMPSFNTTITKAEVDAMAAKVVEAQMFANYDDSGDISQDSLVIGLEGYASIKAARTDEITK